MANQIRHMPLRISPGTPSNIITADGMHIPISWSDSRLENPYEEAEKMAEVIILACNSHYDLVEALSKLLEACGQINGPSYKSLHIACKALAHAKERKHGSH